MSFLVAKQCLRTLSVRCFSSSASRNQKLVNLSVDDKTGIATLELNRSPVNSLNTALLQNISDSLTEVDQNGSKGLILTSSSPTVFSAGLDISVLYKSDLEKVKQLWTILQTVWIQLYGSSFPTAAAINGHCLAGGCSLALCCEYRVMCSNSTIGLNETEIGMVVPEWSQASLRNVISVREAEKALTLGTRFTTSEALEIGLIDEEASDKQDALNRCTKFLSQFAKVSSDARASTKLNFRGKEIAELKIKRKQDVQRFLNIVDNPTVQQGLEMYMQALKAKKSS